MSVYVDPITEHGGNRSFKWPRSCHLYADSPDELHAMAKAIGLRREWFQDRPDFPHYDLVPARRVRAVALGAIEQEGWHAVEFAQRRRGARMSGDLFEGVTSLMENLNLFG